MANTFEKHTKSDKIKWIATFVAFILLLSAVATSLFMSINNKKVIDDQHLEEAAGGLEIDGGSSAGIKLMSAMIARKDFEQYGITPLADSAYTLAATLTPADAENKLVDYSVKWSNASSTWANGKNVSDYVTVNQATDGALNATLTCRQAFGEKVVVTVTSRANSSATATADLHYKQRTLGYEMSISNSQNSAFTLKSSAATHAVKLNFNVVAPATISVAVKKSDVYTRENDDAANYWTISATQALKTAVTNAGLTALTVKDFTSANVSGGTLANFLDKNWGSAIFSTNAANRNKLINALVGFRGNAYEVKIYDRQGGTVLATYNLTLDTSVISGQKVVERVDLDKTEIVF